jgi:hypothetical protein
MVLPWVIGLVGVSGGLYVLYGLISHVLTPLSMLVGVVAGLGTLVVLKEQRWLGSVGGESAVTAAEVGVAVLVGLFVYKALAWILAGAGVVMTVVLAGVIFLGWGPAVFWLVRVLAAWWG